MKIQEEIEMLGSLKNVAAAMVDCVACMAKSSKSEFNRYGYEWTLEPDNWINLHFIYCRKNCIHISLGMPASKFGNVPSLKIKPGRFAAWSRITLESARQLPVAMRCVETAYYVSNNRYRNEHGKPLP